MASIQLTDGTTVSEADPEFITFINTAAVLTDGKTPHIDKQLLIWAASKTKDNTASATTDSSGFAWAGNVVGDTYIGSSKQQITIVHNDDASTTVAPPAVLETQATRATVQREDAVGSTLLRRLAVDSQAADVWVESLSSITDGAQVTRLKEEGQFTFVRTDEGVEGYLKSLYLRPIKVRPCAHA